MLVTIDTNEWRSSRLLRSPSGVALLYALRRGDSSGPGHILLPVSTKCEIINEIIDLGMQEVSKLSACQIGIRILLGREEQTQDQPTTNEDFRKAAEERLATLASVIWNVSHTGEQLELALKRVLEHRPPAHKSEEFRDSLFWEVALSNAAGPTGRGSREINVVTHDKAFYQDGNLNLGLADELHKEALSKGTKVSVYPNLPGFLASLGDRAKVDENVIVSELSRLISRPSPEWPIPPSRVATCHIGGRLDGPTNFSVKAFKTENPEIATLSFELGYRWSDYSIREELQRLMPEFATSEPVILSIGGEAVLNLKTAEIGKLQVNGAKFSKLDGTPCFPLPTGLSVYGFEQTRRAAATELSLPLPLLGSQQQKEPQSCKK